MTAAEPLHILVLTDRDWTHPQGGGTGTNLFGQVSRWLAWGHRVSVVACSYPGAERTEQIDGLTIFRVGGRSTVFPRAIWRQWRGLVPDPDVVVEVINGITFLTPLWLRSPRVALVHHIHRDHYEREMGRKGKLAAYLLETAPLRLLYGSARFLTISRASARDIEAHGIPPEQVNVGYIGVELGAFEPAPESRAEEPTLLYLGRLKRYKRIELLLDALEEVPQAKLEIAGDGDHREELEHEIAERGLGDRVVLHGHVSEDHKRALFQRAWLNLTASSAEGWCLTVMEAAACETPSVALAVGGLPESIEHGETGLLAHEPEDLGRHIRSVVEDPGLRDRLGQGARRRALGFTWEKAAGESLELLRAEVQSHEENPPEPALRKFARSDAGRAAGLAAALMANNVIALGFTIVFARLLGASGYGSLGALIAAFTVLLVPGSALQATVAREVSTAVAAESERPAAGVRRWCERLLVLLVALTIVSIVFREQAAAIVGVDQEWAAAAILPSGVIWFLLCVERGVLQGLGRYRLVALSLFAEAGARLGFGLLFYAIGLGVTGAFLGTTFSIIGLALVLALPLARVVRDEGPGDERPFRELLGDAWAPVAAFALVAVLQNIDIVFVKHTASSSDAGSYAAASIAAKAVIWVAVGLGLYLLPEAVRRSWRGLDARPVLAQTLALVAVIAVPMVLVYAVAGEQVLSAAFGPDLTAAAGALPLLGVAMSLLACAYLAVQYLLALRRSGFVPLLGLAAVVELGVLMLVGSALVDVALVVVCLQLVLAPAVFTLVMRSAGRLAHSGDALA